MIDFYLNNKIISGDDFLPVQRNTDILMGVSVEVMTRAAEGDPEHLHVIFKDDKGQSAGSLEIVLKESSTYHFGQCSGFREYFPSVVPTGMEKTWSIQKTIVNEDIRVQLRCNDVQVLDVVLSDTVCNNGEMGDTWKSYWEKEIVVINFPNEDTASTSYKIIGGARLVLANDICKLRWYNAKLYEAAYLDNIILEKYRKVTSLETSLEV